MSKKVNKSRSTNNRAAKWLLSLGIGYFVAILMFPELGMILGRFKIVLFIAALVCAALGAYAWVTNQSPKALLDGLRERFAHNEEDEEDEEVEDDDDDDDEELVKAESKVKPKAEPKTKKAVEATEASEASMVYEEIEGFVLWKDDDGVEHYTPESERAIPKNTPVLPAGYRWEWKTGRLTAVKAED